MAISDEERRSARGWMGQTGGPEIFQEGIRFEECPVRASLGVLGKKWTLLILRDIGFRKIGRFNDLLRSNPGLGPRILSRRLKELDSKGFIHSLDNRDKRTVVRWSLTRKGRDTIPILVQFVVFGAKWCPDEVFEDKKPRQRDELFVPRAAELMKQL